MIRPYNDADYLFTRDLQKENMITYIDKYWGGWNPETYRKGLEKGITWIVELEGARVGFFVLNFRKGNAHLKNIQVCPAHQGKGLGGLVLGHCERMAGEHRLGELYLEVFKDNPAKNLYDRMGYAVYEISETHYKMRKRL